MIDPNKGKNELKQVFLSLIGLLIVIVIAVIIISNRSSDSSSVTTTTVKKVCWRCGKDLTNDMNYIETDPGKYECTPCYEATMKGIHDEMKTEGYYQDREYQK